MSYLLCHCCFSWVEPRRGLCPECNDGIDTSMPDPSLQQLQLVIGRIDCLLGEVIVKRKSLPDRGLLYATTNGLYFLPHEVDYETQMVERQGVGSSFMWWLAALVWSPLVLIVPFIKNKKKAPQTVQVLRPQFLEENHEHTLPEMLMRNPGVFFIPRDSVRFISRRRKCWIIERAFGIRLNLQPVTRRQFHERMNELIRSHAWRDVMFD